MVISLADVISIIILPIGALVFLGLALYLRGQFWWPILSGLLFILFGIHCVTTIPIFAFMKELSAAWIIIGIAIFWMPAWYRKKKDDKTLIEMAEQADNRSNFDEWCEDEGDIPVSDRDKENLYIQYLREKKSKGKSYWQQRQSRFETKE